MSMVEGDTMPNVVVCENMVEGEGTLYCMVGADKERMRDDEPLGIAMASGAFLRLNGFTAEEAAVVEVGTDGGGWP